MRSPDFVSSSNWYFCSLVARELLVTRAAGHLRVFRRDDRREVHRQHFGPVVTAETLAGPIDRGEIAFEIHGEDDVVGVFEELSIPLFAGPERRIPVWKLPVWRVEWCQALLKFSSAAVSAQKRSEVNAGDDRLRSAS